MKKIYLLSLIALFFFACNEGTSNNEDENNIDQTEDQTESSGSESSSMVKYPFKSGIVKYESDVMGMKTSVTIYFKGYGKEECSVSEVDMMGKKMTMRNIIKDGFMYSLSMEQKSGTKMKVSPEFSNYRFNADMFEEKMEAEGGKKLGTGEVLGKKCQIYSMMQEGAESKIWIWNNMLMKMSAEQNGMTYTIEAVNIEETNNFPDGIFDIPADFNITEEAEMDMDIDDFGDENADG